MRLLSFDRRRRSGFTLIELLIAIGIVGVLSSAVLIAVNPSNMLTQGEDAKRNSGANQIQKAMQQSLIENGTLPAEALIPPGEENAKAICVAGAADPSCLSISAELVPTYLAALPRDPHEKCPSYTGFKAYLKNGRVVIVPSHLGKKVDQITVDPLCGGTSTSTMTVSIANGGSVSLGAVTQGAPHTPAGITISNTGGAPLTISGFTITQTSGAFTVRQNGTVVGPLSEFTVVAGGSIQLDIEMTTSSAGNVTGAIAFTSDDPGLPAYAVNVSGSVSAGSTAAISGRVYNTNGTTALGSVPVAVSVNGQAVAATVTADAGGNFSFPGLSIANGDTVALFLDNHATHKAVTVFRGASASMTNLTLIKDALIVQSGTGGSALGSPVTSAVLASAASVNDADITAIYSAAGNSITVAASKTLDVRQNGVLTLGGAISTPVFRMSGGAVNQGANTFMVSGDFTQSAGTFTGGSAPVSIGSDFLVSGGSFTSTTDTLSVVEDFTVSAPGTFAHNAGTVAFTGNLGSNVTCGSATFNVVAINKTATSMTVTFGSSCNLTFGNSPTMAGRVVNNGTLTLGTGTWTLNGLTNNGTITTGLSALTVTGDFVANAGSTLTMAGKAVAVATNFTMNGGTIPSNIDLTLNGNLSSNVTCGSATFNSVAVNKAATSMTVTFGSSCNLTFGNSPTMAGRVVNNGTLTLGTGTWTLNGLTNNGTINSSLSSLVVTGDLIANAGSTLTMAGSAMTVSTDFTVNGGTLPSNIDLTLTGFLGSSVTCGSASINSMVVSKSAPSMSVSLAANCTVAGNFTLSSGIFSPGTRTLHVGGNWVRTGGTFTQGASTINFTGTNQAISGSNTFYNLTKSVSAASTLTFTAGTTQSVQGTLTLNGTAGNLLSLRSSAPGTAWNINPQGARSVSYLDVRDSTNAAFSSIACGTTCVNSGNNTNWSF